MGGGAEALQAFADAFNAGDTAALAGTLSRRFHGYEPRPGEADQREVFSSVAADLREGIPDAHLTVHDVTAEGEGTTAKAVLAGHLTGTLFGRPGRGQQYELRAEVHVRDHDDGIALAFTGVDIVGNLRITGVLSYPTFGHLPVDPYPRIPEPLVRLAFNGAVLQERACAHLAAIEVTEPTADTCAPCDAEGTPWPALRQCLTCGHVGCCDAATNTHARRHHEETGHPLVRSIMPGEAWIWCYADASFHSSWHLTRR